MSAFPLERAYTHGSVVITNIRPLSFVTPPARWAYAVSIPAAWPPAAGRIHERDGAIRVRLRVLEGSVSVFAAGANRDVIDETFVASTAGAVDVDLVSVPFGRCHEVVVRNEWGDGASSVEVEGIEYLDLGPTERPGDELDPPADCALKPVDDWARYYGAATSLPERVRSARYAALDRVKCMSWLEGLKVRIYPNDDLSRALYISGLYEPLTLLVLRRVLRPGATFVDVGANAGLFSLLASRWVGGGGRVYAFEPSEREYGRLIDHVKLNALKNVTAVRQAVGSAYGSAPLRVAPFPNAGHNTLGASFAYPTVATERIETVCTETLDRFVVAEQLQRVDAIKMDIEGSELAALSGSRALVDRFRPVLIVEVSRGALAACGSTPEQLLDWLTDARYRVCRIGGSAELIPLAAGEGVSDTNVVAVPEERELV